MPAFVPTEDNLSRMSLLSPEQEIMVDSQIKVLDRAISMSRGQDGYQGTALMDRNDEVPLPDPEQLEASRDRDMQTKEMGTPPNLSPHQKNQVFRWIEDNEKIVRGGMLSMDQMRDDGNLTYVSQCVRHHEENGRKIKGLENAYRILDPDFRYSLEAMRPTTANHVDWQRLRENYAHVQWTDDREVEIRMQDLDPETYAAFLELKAAGVESDVLIMRKIGTDRTGLEACELRRSSAMASLQKELDAEASIPDADDPVADFMVDDDEPLSLTIVADDVPDDAKLVEQVAKELTQFERESIDAHMAASMQFIDEGDATTATLRETLGVKDNVAQAVVRALQKIGAVEKQSDGSLLALEIKAEEEIY